MAWWNRINRSRAGIEFPPKGHFHVILWGPILVFLCFCSLLSLRYLFGLTPSKSTSPFPLIDNLNHSHAIVTNLQTEEYALWALTLAYTIEKYNPNLVADRILLLPTDHGVSQKSIARFELMGWRIRIEENIHVEGTEKIAVPYRKNFIKLRVWKWIEYQKIAMIDADTMVTGDISLLLSDGYGNIFYSFLLI